MTETPTAAIQRSPPSARQRNDNGGLSPTTHLVDNCRRAPRSEQKTKYKSYYDTRDGKYRDQSFALLLISLRNVSRFRYIAALFPDWKYRIWNRNGWSRVRPKYFIAARRAAC